MFYRYKHLYIIKIGNFIYFQYNAPPMNDKGVVDMMLRQFVERNREIEERWTKSRRVVKNETCSNFYNKR